MFGGGTVKYREWMSKPTSFIAVTRASGLPWLAWATTSNEVILDTDIEFEYAQESDGVKSFRAKLQQLFSTVPRVQHGASPTESARETSWSRIDSSIRTTRGWDEERGVETFGMHQLCEPHG